MSKAGLTTSAFCCLCSLKACASALVCSAKGLLCCGRCCRNSEQLKFPQPMSLQSVLGGRNPSPCPSHLLCPWSGATAQECFENHVYCTSSSYFKRDTLAQEERWSVHWSTRKKRKIIPNLTANDSHCRHFRYSLSLPSTHGVWRWGVCMCVCSVCVCVCVL